MKVRELIKALEDLNDPDADVVVRGYEDGVNDATSVEATFIERDKNDEWYYGQHNQVSASASDVNAVRAYEIYGANKLAGEV